MSLHYERDGARIYAASFATIRAEADLTGVPPELEPIVVRMIHASGDVGIVASVEASVGIVAAARAALGGGAPIWCDSQMVADGITRARLPAGNMVRCTLRDEGVAESASALGTTRSAAAVDHWLAELAGPELAGPGAAAPDAGDVRRCGWIAVVGNAPTALFRLLEHVVAGDARPAAIVGIPVGFVGAAESKAALAALAHDIPFVTVHGRRGGGAMAAAAVDTLADPRE